MMYTFHWILNIAQCPMILHLVLRSENKILITLTSFNFKTNIKMHVSHGLLLMSLYVVLGYFRISKDGSVSVLNPRRLCFFTVTIYLQKFTNHLPCYLSWKSWNSFWIHLKVNCLLKMTTKLSEVCSYICTLNRNIHM